MREFLRQVFALDAHSITKSQKSKAQSRVLYEGNF
jgi:hypothetical protein